MVDSSDDDASRTRSDPGSSYFTRDRELNEAEIERDIRELKDHREENLDVLNELMTKHKELRDKQLELDDAMGGYYEFLEGTDMSGRLLEEYSELLDDHTQMLESRAEAEQRGAYYRIGAGLGSIGTGAWIADIYSSQEGLFHFYSNILDIAGEAPEAAMLGAGLPALGVYAIKKGLDRNTEAVQHQEELTKYRARKRNLEE